MHFVGKANTETTGSLSGVSVEACQTTEYTEAAMPNEKAA
jgi:hypothetical protein